MHSEHNYTIRGHVGSWTAEVRPGNSDVYYTRTFRDLLDAEDVCESVVETCDNPRTMSGWQACSSAARSKTTMSAYVAAGGCSQ